MMTPATTINNRKTSGAISCALNKCWNNSFINPYSMKMEDRNKINDFRSIRVVKIREIFITFKCSEITAQVNADLASRSREEIITKIVVIGNGSVEAAITDIRLTTVPAILQ